MEDSLLLFTPNIIGGVWETEEKNRREFFTKHFNKIVKPQFKLTKDQTIYCFRHTSITKVYKMLLKSDSTL